MECEMVVVGRIFHEITVADAVSIRYRTISPATPLYIVNTNRALKFIWANTNNQWKRFDSPPNKYAQRNVYIRTNPIFFYVHYTSSR